MNPQPTKIDGPIRPLLADLPEDQVERLREWLVRDSLTYAETVKRAKAELGLSISSSSLSKFWTIHCAPTPKYHQGTSDEIYVVHIRLPHPLPTSIRIEIETGAPPRPRK